MRAALGAAGDMKARVGREMRRQRRRELARFGCASGQAGAPVQAMTRSSGSSARVTRPSCCGISRRPSTRIMRHGVRRRPGARPARKSSVSLCIWPKARPTSAPLGMNPGLGRSGSRRRLALPANASGSVAPPARCAAMRPRPSLAPPEATNHSASDSAVSTASVLRDGASSLRAIGAHDQAAIGAALDADIGRRLREHAARAAIDRKAEFLRQAERVARQAPAPVPPPAHACRRLRARTARR